MESPVQCSFLATVCINFTTTKPWPRRIRWAGYVAGVEKNRTVYRVWRGKYGEKRAFARGRHKWEDNIKMNLNH